MSDSRLTISAQDAQGEGGDRFDRFRLISWWDQNRLSSAKVLVVGAGALGNEIIKNLSLLGIGQILVADLDRVENSNLSRSVLYRESDNGCPKADAAVRGARDIYPKIKAQAFNGNVVYDLGMGVYRWADLVIGGLDNREARLAINRACWKVNRPWIDGAIEQIQGAARVFVPDGPCYECTMSEMDWKLLRMRRSCNLLTREQMMQERTPTTPTISSIIAGVQCQEAVKLLHGMEAMAGKAWMFAGLTNDSYQIEFQRKEDCYSHDTLGQIVSLEQGASQITLRQLLDQARQMLGPAAELELGRDVLHKLVCPKCHDEEILFISLGKVSVNAANCPRCQTVRREPVTFYKIRGDEPFLDRTAAHIGVPAFDIVIGRNGAQSVGLELSGDAQSVLGELWEGGELEWT